MLQNAFGRSGSMELCGNKLPSCQEFSTLPKAWHRGKWVQFLLLPEVGNGFWGRWVPAALITWNISIVTAALTENLGLQEYREHQDHVGTMKCLGRSEGNSTAFKCVTLSRRAD